LILGTRAIIEGGAERRPFGLKGQLFSANGAPLALENGIGNEVLIDDGRDDEKINSAANALSRGRTG